MCWIFHDFVLLNWVFSKSPNVNQQACCKNGSTPFGIFSYLVQFCCYVNPYANQKLKPWEKVHNQQMDSIVYISITFWNGVKSYGILQIQKLKLNVKELNIIGGINCVQLIYKNKMTQGIII